MLKKTTIALFITAASTIATAGSMGPVCKPGAVTVPCETKQWSFAVDALYLKPMFNKDLAYTAIAPTNTALLQSNAYRSLDADWDLGYRLQAAYYFSTGADLSLDWSHFDASSNLGYATTMPVTRLSGASLAGTLNADNLFDQVNLVMGQHVDLGLVKDAHFFGGLQYANLAHNTQLALPNNRISDSAFASSYYNNSQFEGFGPVLGVDYAYNLVQGLSLTAKTSASMIYGSTRSSAGLQVLSSGSPIMFSTAYASSKSVIAGLEGKLGANYAFTTQNGVLNLEGGYQVMDYLNALTTVNLAGQFGQSDYALSGPYLGLKWLANA